MTDGPRRTRDKKFDTLVKARNVDVCIERICGLFDIDFVAYHLGIKDVSGVETPYLRTNYSVEWVGRYLLKNYLETDPVAKAAYQTTEPVLWSDLDWSSRQAREFMSDALNHGVGQSGLLVPIVDRRQRRAMINFSSHEDDTAWRERMETIQGDLIECAHILHEKALADLYSNRDDGPKLSPRELECLKMASEGMEAGEMARSLKLSEHTVRDYLKSARWKLGSSNIAQAMHKATVLRLI